MLAIDTASEMILKLSIHQEVDTAKVDYSKYFLAKGIKQLQFPDHADRHKELKEFYVSEIPKRSQESITCWQQWCGSELYQSLVQSLSYKIKLGIARISQTNNSEMQIPQGVSRKILPQQKLPELNHVIRLISLASG